MPRKKMLTMLVSLCIALMMLTACTQPAANPGNPSGMPTTTVAASPTVTASADAENQDEQDGSEDLVDYSRVNAAKTRLAYTADSHPFTPWDEADVVSIEPLERKAYTILIYCNGSNLESDGGCATEDIVEMAGSQFDETQINVVLLTGGTAQWMLEVIPTDCALFQIEDGGLTTLGTLPENDMMNAGTLAGFIDYGMEYFPADQYGLILWNHGGGPLGGYGMDELNEDITGLSVPQIEYALANSQAALEPFEFIGFDACLMSSMEVAAMMNDYAHYLYASEETLPGPGYDYGFLGDLSDDPGMDGAQLGQIITQRIIAYNKEHVQSMETTFAVLDLTRTGPLLLAFDDMMGECAELLNDEDFADLSRVRYDTKYFGDTGPREPGYDLVDLGDLLERFEEDLNLDTLTVRQALTDMIVYSDNSQGVIGANGLTVYFPYTALEQEMIEANLDFYDAMALCPQYTEFMFDFVDMMSADPMNDMDFSEYTPDEYGNLQIDPALLDSIVEANFVLYMPIEENVYIMLGMINGVSVDDEGNILTEFDGQWASIDGEIVCLYLDNEGENYAQYAIPATYNGEDVDLIVEYSDLYPDGHILGARPYQQGNVASRYLYQIKPGDVIQFDYYALDYSDDAQEDGEEVWYGGYEFTVEDELILEFIDVPEGIYYYGFTFVDIQQNEYWTDFLEVEF